MLHHVVMGKMEKRNEIEHHNDSITARPRIYFRERPGEWDRVIGIAPHTREFTSSHVTLGTPEYKEMEQAITTKSRNRLRALRLLRYVCVESDETAARKTLVDAGQLIFDDPKLAALFAAGGDDPRKAASDAYRQFFNEELRGSWLAVQRTKRGEFIPVIRCDDMKTAMFAFAAFRGLETCLNCQKLFVVDAPRPDDSSSERYCSGTCGQRYRQKLYRLRVKGISKRKGKRR